MSKKPTTDSAKKKNDRHAVERWGVYLPGKFKAVFEELASDSRRTLTSELVLALECYLKQCGKKIPE